LQVPLLEGTGVLLDQYTWSRRIHRSTRHPGPRRCGRGMAARLL